MSGLSGAMETEVTVGDQPTHQITSTFSMKITNFKRFTDTQEEGRSKYIEIWPGKKIAFIIKNLPKKALEFRPGSREGRESLPNFTLLPCMILNSYSFRYLSYSNINNNKSV